MTSVIFKGILIADTEKSRAKRVEFQPGLNVITSGDNHVGKSSLAKSLYYCLGAEINYDSSWRSTRKMYALDFVVNDKSYRIVRQNKIFLVFCGDELVRMCSSVSKELAPTLEEIFGFSVYLPDKDTKRHVMAPPVFTYLPYYIDQDTGWENEPYESFASLGHFKKKDRIKSLYYHLGVYNKESVDLQAKIDANDEQVEKLKMQIERIEIALEALTSQVQGLIPAETIEELEYKLEPTKRRIEVIVGELIQVRTKMQKLESDIIQHRKHLPLLERPMENETTDTSSFACPKCGFLYGDEIPAIVREKYSAENGDYLFQQVSVIIETLKMSLTEEQERYVRLTDSLKQEEKTATQLQDNYETYVKQRGLLTTIDSMHQRIGEATEKQNTYNAETKAWKNKLRKLPNKKAVEERYIDDTRRNIIRLGAWDSEYENKIGLLKPLKAQGTLSSKIILAQYVSLFSTMQAIGVDNTRFPFVVDSPRTKEPSNASSIEIINMISTISTLPQIILVTMDYQTLDVENKDSANIIVLTEERRLLNEADYQSSASTIQRYEELLSSVPLRKD
jgi:hypothetical protein